MRFIFQRNHKIHRIFHLNIGFVGARAGLLVFFYSSSAVVLLSLCFNPIYCHGVRLYIHVINLMFELELSEPTTKVGAKKDEKQTLCAVEKLIA